MLKVFLWTLTIGEGVTVKIWGAEIDWKKIWLKIHNHIANAISISRIVCSPIVAIMMICAFYQFVIYGKMVWPKNYSDFVFYLYLACQVSDALDGIVAKLLGTTSRWGAILDRAGDKILIVPIFFLMFLFYLLLAFRFNSLLAFPIAGLLLASVYLERTLAKYGLKGFKTNAPVESNWYGKVKMVLQCLLSSYWIWGLLSPDAPLNLYYVKIPMDPLAVHNLIFTLVLLSTIVTLTVGSIAVYKALPEYKKMLGENDG